MANSLRAKISKLKHDGNITEEEYQALLKKLTGHDKEIRSKVIDEFAEAICNKTFENCFRITMSDGQISYPVDVVTLDYVTEIAFEMAEQLKAGETDGNSTTDS